MYLPGNMTVFKAVVLHQTNHPIAMPKEHLAMHADIFYHHNFEEMFLAPSG
jgi:hypothetical protein